MSDFFQTILYQPIFNLLFFFVDLFPGESLGLGVIALTALVRFLLIPSSAQAVRAQKEMTAIQPEIEKVRKKYHDQPEKLNQEILKLYQEHRVNPLGSCLPLLIQLPVLIILYQVLIQVTSVDDFKLLYNFIPKPEQLNTIFLSQNLDRPSIIFGIVAGALQFVQSWQLLQKSPKNNQSKEIADKNAATEIAKNFSTKFIYFMPFMTVAIALSLPSALAIYWIVTTIFSIVQQYFLFKNPAIATPHVAVKVKGPHIAS